MGIVVHLPHVVLSKFCEVLAIASIKACEGGVGVIGHGAVRGSELREPP